MNVERTVIKKVAHAAAGVMLMASLNLPRLAHADSPPSDPKSLYNSGQEFIEASSQKEIEPVFLDVDVLMYHEVTAIKLKIDN
ncbi:MAG: hypothetical protein HYW86_04230 [Candidatus Roizmanbacteria bacterium]|nr:MAG: hypothetical protein HYW86_04230 [Candidatus Roizmanbacteria bacterium]